MPQLLLLFVLISEACLTDVSVEDTVSNALEGVPVSVLHLLTVVTPMSTRARRRAAHTRDRNPRLGSEEAAVTTWLSEAIGVTPVGTLDSTVSSSDFL
jgi:hypothetical protein